MRIADIRIISKPLVRAKAAEVDRLESILWAKFPNGYREYVTQLGDGIFADWVRIYPPRQIARELGEWRDRIDRYWFWDKGRRLLPKSRAMECIIVGDTINGDELVFHPSRRNALFVLPRDNEKIFAAGNDLLSAIDWLCKSGKFTEPISEYGFEPYGGSRAKWPRQAKVKKKSGDPIGQSFDDIMKSAMNWAKRHRLLQRATAQVKSPFKKLPVRQLQIRAGRQFAVFVPETLEQNFAVEFHLRDLKTGLDIATLEVQQKTDGSWDIDVTPDPDNFEKLKKRYGGDTFSDPDGWSSAMD